MQRAYELGFDVANMSLGGGSNGVRDLLSQAVDRFDRAGMVSAIAAGNTGPGDETVESPGFAPRAITAGASSVGHFVGAPVTTADGGRFGAASGEFATVTEDLTAPLAVVTEGATDPATGLSTACSALAPGSLSGEIALVSRGTCSFSTKIRNAQAAGAIAVLVVNNVAGDPVAMASDDTPEPADHPGLHGRAGGWARPRDQGRRPDHDRTRARVLPYRERQHHGGLLESRAHRRPVPRQAGRRRPRRERTELAAGLCVRADDALVLGVLPGHVDGDPARRGLGGRRDRPASRLGGRRRPLRDREHRRSGSAAGLRTGETIVDNPNVVGAGLENLLNAVQASVSLDPVSVAFGGIPSGSGQNRSGEIIVKNLTDSTATFAFSIEDPFAGGASYTVSPASVTLAPGATTTIRVTVDVPRAFPQRDDWAWLLVSTGGSEVAHAALYTRTK